MTDPNRHVPSYHDPHGGMGTSDNVVGLNEFLDISVDDYEQSYDIMFNVEGNNDHPSRWGSQNTTQFVNDPSQAGPSGVHDQTSGQNTGYFDPKNSASEKPTQISELPYDCTYCQVLRNIIHTKGEEETTKLEIHGRIGMVCHGILEIHDGDMTAPNKEYHTFDFCKKSIFDVKKFLVEYFEDRAKAYYTMVNDPLLTFYETLCVQSDWDWVFDDIFQGSPGNTGTDQPEAQSDKTRPRKRTYKEQIEYAKSLRLKDFVKYFHLTEEEAAKCVGVSPSTVKKICRHEGLQRWPFRKVDAIERKIRGIISSTDPSDPRKVAKAETVILRLQNERAVIYAPYE